MFLLLAPLTSNNILKNTIRELEITTPSITNKTLRKSFAANNSHYFLIAIFFHLSVCHSGSNALNCCRPSKQKTVIYVCWSAGTLKVLTALCFLVRFCFSRLVWCWTAQHTAGTNHIWQDREEAKQDALTQDTGSKKGNAQTSKTRAGYNTKDRREAQKQNLKRLCWKEW